MANEQVTGTVILRKNGISMRSDTGATLKLGGKQRTPRYADGQVIGYTVKVVPSELSATLVHTGTTDLADLNNVDDDTITFECDSGPVYTIGGAFSSEPPELTDDGGGVKVSFMGQPAIQTT